MTRKSLCRLTASSLLAAFVACNFVGAERIDSTAATRPTVASSGVVDLKKTVEYLASDELEGRYIGTPGIEKAGEMIADDFQKMGLKPMPGLDGYFQPFTMTTGVKIDPATVLAAGAGKDWVGPHQPKLGFDYQPLGFSAEGKFDGKVVFAGYGITSPDRGYDDYADLDAKGKVVLALRFEPHDKEGKSRFAAHDDEWSPHATIPQKAKNAADHGAVALLLVNPPNHHGEGDAIMPFARLFQFGRAGIPIIQVKQDIANKLLQAGGANDLKALQDKIDESLKPASADLKDVSAKGEVVFKKQTKDVRNVVAMLPGKGEHANEYVVIGAHYDHLGHGAPGSLAPLSKAIHHGADDNASGTTAMLAIAERFAHMGPQARTLIFCAFTAEEEGLIGSDHFVKKPPVPLDKIVAMLNLDMVGRVREERLLIGGSGTAENFQKILDEADKGSPLKLQSFGKGGMGPSDHTSFATKKIPVLFFFSGLHMDYHRPTDTADKINYEGMQQVVDLGVKVVHAMADMPREQYVGKFDSDRMSMGAGTGSGGSHVMLGVVPDYSDETVKGVPITGTTPGSPADKAGLKSGDTLLQFNNTKLNSLMDLSEALSKSKPGDKAHIILMRDGKQIETDTTLVERKG